MRRQRLLPLEVAALLLSSCATVRERQASTLTPAVLDRGPGVHWSIIGLSRQGRDIVAATPVRGGDGPRVLIIGGIHGDETEGLAHIDRLAAELSAGSARIAGTVRVIRDMNPDGTATGTRGNAAGVDLNRNWPAANFELGRRRGERPLSQPESATVAADVDRFRPTLVIVLHSSSSGPFVNYDGPADEQATAFAQAASMIDERWRVVADMGYATPGSLGSWIGDDRRVPILTIEFQRGQERGVWEALRDGVWAVVDDRGPARR